MDECVNCGRPVEILTDPDDGVRLLCHTDGVFNCTASYGGPYAELPWSHDLADVLMGAS